MRNKPIFIVVLLAGFFALTGESCILETKEIEVPVRDDEDFTFTTAGSAEHSGSEIVDFLPTLLDLEEDNTFEELISAHIEAGLWRVAVNRGSTDLVINGAVTVTRLHPAAAGVHAVAQTAQFFAYTSVPIASVTGEEFVVAPVEAAGIALLNDGLEEYLDARDGGAPLPNLEYRFDWAGTATAAGTPAVDFDWQAKVRFTLVGLVEVDVPEIF